VGWTCSIHGVRHEHGILNERLEGKRPLGRPRRRCNSNISMDLKNRFWACGDTELSSSI